MSFLITKKTETVLEIHYLLSSPQHFPCGSDQIKHLALLLKHNALVVTWRKSPTRLKQLADFVDWSSFESHWSISFPWQSQVMWDIRHKRSDLWILPNRILQCCYKNLSHETIRWIDLNLLGWDEQRFFLKDNCSPNLHCKLWHLNYRRLKGKNDSYSILYNFEKYLLWGELF